MKIIYEGVDITDKVKADECTFTDSCDDRADLLEFTFARPQDWLTWKPHIDDEVRVTHGNIDTGIMYVTEIEPQDNTYGLVCSTLKRATREKRWKSWQNVTLGNILAACADMCSMGWALFGLNANTHYEFMSMQNESVPAFLRRLMNMEGGVLKCCNGKFIGIGAEYANKLTATQTMTINDKTMSGITWSVMPYLEWKSVVANGYYGIGVSIDKDVESGDSQTFILPVTNNAEARRWAAGMLLTNNMKSETITISTGLNTGLTAMGRIDIVIPNGMNGAWLVKEVAHDIVKETSEITLIRCRTGVV